MRLEHHQRIRSGDILELHDNVETPLGRQGHIIAIVYPLRPARPFVEVAWDDELGGGEDVPIGDIIGWWRLR
jgi:hypothetical protein